MGVTIHLGTQIESLADRLADLVAETRRAQPDEAFFEPTRIVVPNRHLRKWVALWIARRQGVAANLQCDFFEDTVWDVLSELDPDATDAVRLDADVLRLMVFSLLESERFAGHEALCRYVGDRDLAGAAQRAWQLAGRLAGYFLEYELHRQEMVAAWLAGRETGRKDRDATAALERDLYRALFGKGELRDCHHAGGGKLYLTIPQYARRIKTFTASDQALHIFGLSHMAPLYCDLVFRLGQAVDVHLYLLSFAGETPCDLLAQWGGVGADMLAVLRDSGARLGAPEYEVVDDAAETNGERPATVLGATQQSILGRTCGRVAQDTSLQIAACPGVRREVETVYNSILTNMAEDETLRLTDIAVLVTDVRTYLPAIRSVFSRDGDAGRGVPYSLCDADAAEASAFAQGVRAVLALAQGAFTRREVFDVVLNPCFLARQGMERDEALTWAEWADRLGVFRHFSVSDKAQALSSAGVPASPRHTWQQGLERLRLGRIMDVPNEREAEGGVSNYQGLVPYADMASADADTVGGFSCVIESLVGHVSGLRDATTRSCAEWADAFNDLFDTFLAPDDDRPVESHVRRRLRQALADLALLDSFLALDAAAGVDLATVAEYVRGCLGGIATSFGRYLTEGVTVSSLRPMCPVPFSIVYVLGLQEGAFPGVADRATLDLRRSESRLGDLDRTDADRYLFLETLMSARAKLVLTYVGTDPVQERDYAPCSVVNQLQTFLETTVLDAERFRVVEMPLSGRSQRYLGDPAAWQGVTDLMTNHSRLDRRLCLAEAYWRDRRGVGPALAEDLKDRIEDPSAGVTVLPDFAPPPDAPAQAHPERMVVTLRDLSRFLLNPSQAVLMKHMGIVDEEDEAAEDEDEPFVSTFPLTHQLEVAPLERYVRTGDAAEAEACLDALYENAQLRSLTPEDAFAEIDREELRQKVRERIEGTKGIEGLEAFVSDADWSADALVAGVAIGAPDRASESAVSFPAPVFEVRTPDGQSREVEVHGDAPLVWRREKEGTTDCRTLAISTAREPKAPLSKHAIEPFLLYMLALAGREKNEQGRTSAQWVGDGTFEVYVSYKDGKRQLPYRVKSDAARAYVQALLDDYLAADARDDLPFNLVVADPPGPADPDGQSGAPPEAYRQRLADAIDRDVRNASFKKDHDRKTFLQLGRARLSPDGSGEYVDRIAAPEDACDKIERRLRPMIPPPEAAPPKAKPKKRGRATRGRATR